ncbi:MAG: ATP-binding protein [Clostridiales Family XIII bacterium]|nr:ATP-binding protein [Clostridiales Family XIII bacterium]
MVSLIVGHKGTGKTKMMIELANDRAEKSSGHIVFVNKNQRLMYDLIHEIRIVCMEDYEEITNSDEYIGFLYGIISSDHDIDAIFIDSILKHADVSTEDIPEFLARLKVISQQHDIDFIVSLSADLEELSDDVTDFNVMKPEGC